jgi:outer membrane immunogenic protein
MQGIEMKKLFLATAAVFAFSAGSAGAADLARPVYKAAPAAPPCAAAKFSGGYIGINGGGVNWQANRTDQDEVLVDSATYVQKKWGGVIGGQIGYNWTTCNTLWGVELDGDWSSAKVTTQLIPNSPLFNINITSRFDGLVTARTRAGVVLDNLLIYVTGGAAAGHFKTSFTNQFNGIPGVIAGFTNQADTSQWRWGWVAGFGTEWAWTDRVTLRSEVLYVDFVDRENRFLFAPPATFANFTQSDSMWISRVGINVKFGDYAPVVAKY